MFDALQAFRYHRFKGVGQKDHMHIRPLVEASDEFLWSGFLDRIELSNIPSNPAVAAHLLELIIMYQGFEGIKPTRSGGAFNHEPTDRRADGRRQRKQNALLRKNERVPFERRVSDGLIGERRDHLRLESKRPEGARANSHRAELVEAE